MNIQNNDIHIDPRGSTKPQSTTPAVVKATSQGEVQKLKTIIGGIILAILTITYCIALFLEIGETKLTPLVGFIGLGIGYLLGNQSNSQ